MRLADELWGANPAKQQGATQTNSTAAIYFARWPTISGIPRIGTSKTSKHIFLGQMQMNTTCRLTTIAWNHLIPMLVDASTANIVVGMDDTIRR